jgi:hypothetical protein
VVDSVQVDSTVVSDDEARDYLKEKESVSVISRNNAGRG